MIYDKTELAVGSGMLFFGRFQPGTMVSEGEDYLGNTPNLTYARNIEETERLTSYGGQKIEIGSDIVRERLNISFTTDHISAKNLALWFSSESESNFTSDAISEQTIVARRGRFYQLGDPLGVSGANVIEVTHNAIPVSIADNFAVDARTGRVQVLPNAPFFSTPKAVTIKYEGLISAVEIITPKLSDVTGSLRFIGNNVVGDSWNYFFPYVTLSSDDVFNIKAQDWQKISFQARARKISPRHEIMYAMKMMPNNLMAADLEAISNEHMLYAEFILIDDMLNEIVNIDFPNALQSQ